MPSPPLEVLAGRVFGLVPYARSSRSGVDPAAPGYKLRWHPSLSWRVFSVALMFGHWAIMVTISAFLNIVGSEDPTMAKFHNVQIILVLSFLCTAIISVVWRQFPMLLHILDEVTVVDNFSQRCIVWSQYLSLIMMLIWFMVMESIENGFKYYCASLVYGAAYLHFEMFRITEYLLFTCVIRNVHMQFLAINEELAQSIRGPEFIRVSGVSGPRTASLRRAHQRTVDLLNTARRCFEWPLLSLLAIDTSFLLVSSSRIFLGPSWFLRPADTLRSVCWIVLRATVPLHLVCSCSSAVEQGQKTAEHVHQYLNRDGLHDNESREVGACQMLSLKIFSMQLLHCNLDISLLDLFSLNRRLIATVSGTLATYLVILAQFKMSNSASMNTTTSAPSEYE